SGGRWNFRSHCRNCTACGLDCTVPDGKARSSASGSGRVAGLFSRSPPGPSGALCDVMLVQRLPDERLDQGLPADIQISGGMVEFVQHGNGEIDIYTLNRSLDGRLHAARAGKKARDVPATVCKLGNLLGGDALCAAMCALHKVSFLRG